MKIVSRKRWRKPARKRRRREKSVWHPNQQNPGSDRQRRRKVTCRCTGVAYIECPHFFLDNAEDINAQQTDKLPDAPASPRLLRPEKEEQGSPQSRTSTVVLDVSRQLYLFNSPKSSSPRSDFFQRALWILSIVHALVNACWETHSHGVVFRGSCTIHVSCRVNVYFAHQWRELGRNPT